MKIAVEGCAHGELEIIYDALEFLEAEENLKIDLLICCGDFQSTRNLQDLRCMAVPPRYYDICSFYKYYSGEKVAPYLTIFIGGNHEASNYLQELPYGGWVAPNIYYIGYGGVVNVAGIRIGGISGIFKGFDYQKGHFEVAPYNENSKRSVYHIRNVEVFRLKQISQPIDIMLSHDWPKGICKYGDVEELIRYKPFLKNDIDSNKLGSPPCKDLLNQLKPEYWFSAHLHCKFAAAVPHLDDSDNVTKVTKFLALDKCLPKRNFLQVIDIPHDSDAKIEIKYDLEWLTILYLTNHLLNISKTNQHMPGPGNDNRWIYTPTQEEKDFVLGKFGHNLVIPENFVPTVPAYSPNDNELDNIEQPCGQTNVQTELFCEKLGIDNPTQLALDLYSITFEDNSSQENEAKTVDTSDINPLPDFQSVPHCIAEHKNNLSLPEPKITETMSRKTKLNLTLPAPKSDSADLNASSSPSTATESSPQPSDDESNSSMNTSSICDDTLPENSTPVAKKFKRRNKSAYALCVET